MEQVHFKVTNWDSLREQCSVIGMDMLIIQLCLAEAMRRKLIAAKAANSEIAPYEEDRDKILDQLVLLFSAMDTTDIEVSTGCVSDEARGDNEWPEFLNV